MLFAGWMLVEIVKIFWWKTGKLLSAWVEIFTTAIGNAADNYFSIIEQNILKFSVIGRTTLV